jgi:RNA polymerase sigma-70 factor (ECF subfamily)
MSDIGRLLEPQLPSLHRYALALTRDASRAEDLVQTCIVRALVNQDRWAEDTNLQGCLFTILHNAFVSQLRRYARERAWRSTADLKPAAMPGSDPEMSYRLIELQTASGNLSDGQREIVLLVGLEGYTYDRVAEALDIPRGTVGSRLSRGRQNLRNVIDWARDPAAAEYEQASEMWPAAIDLATITGFGTTRWRRVRPAPHGPQ